MLSRGRFKIGNRDVRIAVIHDEKIHGITFTLHGEDALTEGVTRLSTFLKRRGVNVQLNTGDPRMPQLIADVITGTLSNEELLPQLSFEGLTRFESRVYEYLTKRVKRGSVVSYGELARELGTSPRAIGGAMKRNPYPIVVPCHRVVAHDGIGYYTPGLEEKTFLLEMEEVKGWTNSKRI